MLTDESIGEFAGWLVQRAASPNTIRAYTTDLRQFKEFANARGVKDQQSADVWDKMASAYLNHYRSERGAKTIGRWVTSIRGWAKFMGHPEILAHYIVPTPAQSQPHPLPDGIADVERMIKVAGPAHLRALVALCGLCGLRVQEACDLMPAHINVEEREITVRGKGDKTRVVPMSARAWLYVQRAYDHAVRDKTTLVIIGNRAARNAITRIGKRAGVTRHISSHDMRSTFGTAAYGASKDLRAVQELLGHASPVTTQVYTGISKETRRNVVESL